MRILIFSLLGALFFGTTTACTRTPRHQESERAGLPGMGAHDFRAVVTDAVSKQPVPSVRIILAPKTAGKLECTIDTSLTEISNQNGELRLQNVKPGEYVVFYNVSGKLHAELNGKVVKYDRVGNDDYAKALSSSLGPLRFLNGGEMGIVDGLISLNNGHIYAPNFDLAMIASEGKLLKVSIPTAGGVPVKIEVHTDIGK